MPRPYERAASRHAARPQEMQTTNGVTDAPPAPEGHVIWTRHFLVASSFQDCAMKHFGFVEVAPPSFGNCPSGTAASKIFELPSFIAILLGVGSCWLLI
jgi:hypothetical protein